MYRICACAALSLLLFGCSNAAPEDTAGAAPAVTVTVTETVTVAPERSDDPPSQEPSSPASDDAVEEPSGDTGTRDNPAKPGANLPLGDWEVVLSATTPNANDTVAAENEFNDPPADGRQFVLVKVTATYVGAETGTAWIDLGFRFLGASGNTFGTGAGDYCGSIPAPLIDAGEVFPGASVEGNVCVSVPSEQVAGGLWIAEESFSFDGEPTFVALA